MSCVCYSIKAWLRKVLLELGSLCYTLNTSCSVNSSSIRITSRIGSFKTSRHFSQPRSEVEALLDELHVLKPDAELTVTCCESEVFPSQEQPPELAEILLCTMHERPAGREIEAYLALHRCLCI